MVIYFNSSLHFLFFLNGNMQILQTVGKYKQLSVLSTSIYDNCSNKCVK